MEQKTLRTLLTESADLENQLIALAGELTPELEQQLIELEQKTPEKVQRYIAFCDRLEMESENLKVKAKKYEHAAKVLENLLDRRRDYIKQMMLENNLTELRGTNESYRVKKAGFSVQITNNSAIPENFIRTKIDQQPDKGRIREELENGGIVPGAELKQTYVLQPIINKGIKT